MAINWKLRLQNKATLAALASAVVGFVYQILGIFGVVPPVSQDAVVSGIALVINVLMAVGVVVDPTTKGVSDSERALDYLQPYETEEA